MRPISDEEFETIKTLYAEGLSLNAIGKKLNRHHGVISYRLRREGVKIDSPGQRAEKRIQTQVLIDLYKGGASLPEIGEKVGMTAQGVHDRLLKTDVKIRSRSDAVKNSFKTGRAKPQMGEDHHSWKGGRYINKNGYIELRLNKRIVLEHRHIWTKSHGELPKNWIVHHLNGIKTDNRIENLCAMPRKCHSPKLIIEPFRIRIKELEKEVNQYKEGENGTIRPNR